MSYSQSLAAAMAKKMAGRLYRDLTCEEMTEAWRLTMAGYLFVCGGVVRLVNPV